jgi:hypothetical protein
MPNPGATLTYGFDGFLISGKGEFGFYQTTINNQIKQVASSPD